MPVFQNGSYRNIRHIKSKDLSVFGDTESVRLTLDLPFLYELSLRLPETLEQFENIGFDWIPGTRRNIMPQG